MLGEQEGDVGHGRGEGVCSQRSEVSLAFPLVPGTRTYPLCSSHRARLLKMRKWL